MNIIGMTEAGDAGLDLSWLNRLQNNLTMWDKPLKNDKYVGAILITKDGHLLKFQETICKLNLPCIIHFDCTGWGSTPMEPLVPKYTELIDAVRKFIDNGFPAERCVLRIDPIIPTEQGIQTALKVLDYASKVIPDVTRIRISIYDDYHTAREEMANRGYNPIDNITKWKNEQERRPTPEQVKMVAKALLAFNPNKVYELCAEPELAKAYPNNFKWFGCLSKKDLDIMGIELPENVGINGQNRYGCRCLMMKRELLNKKMRCPNNCAYCYWGRN